MNKLTHLLELTHDCDPKFCWPVHLHPAGYNFVFNSLGAWKPVCVSVPNEWDYLYVYHAIKQEVARRSWRMSLQQDVSDSSYTGIIWYDLLTGDRHIQTANDEEAALALLECYVRSLYFKDLRKKPMLPIFCKR